MKGFILALATASALLAEPDPRELVKKSLANYLQDWRARLNYTYTQRDVEMKSGTKATSVNQVTTIDGTPYERLVQKDGRPLSPAEEAKEKEKYEKTVEERNRETPEQRQKRVADYERQRNFLKEVPDAFRFKLLGEQNLNGRPAYIVHCSPNPDFEPHGMSSRIFPKIEAKLYIDKQDIRWARAEADVIDTVAFGFFLARVGKGAKILMEMTPLNDHVWAPKRIDVNGTARIMIVRNRDLAEEITFSDYRAVKPSSPGISTHGSSNTAHLDNVKPASR